MVEIKLPIVEHHFSEGIDLDSGKRVTINLSHETWLRLNAAHMSLQLSVAHKALIKAGSTRPKRINTIKRHAKVNTENHVVFSHPIIFERMSNTKLWRLTRFGIILKKLILAQH